MLFPYLAPIAGDSAKRMFLLRTLIPDDDAFSIPSDIRQYVVAAFHAHNKDVPRSVLPKLENTEIILRHSLGGDRKYWQSNTYEVPRGQG